MSPYKTNITALAFETYYYISPQLRLKADVDFGYYFSESNPDGYYLSNLPKRWEGSYSVTLTYSLF